MTDKFEKITPEKSPEEIKKLVEELAAQDKKKFAEPEPESKKEEVKSVTKAPEVVSSLRADAVKLVEVRRILNRYGVPPGDMEVCLNELEFVLGLVAGEVAPVK